MNSIFANPEKSIAAKLIIATGLLIVVFSFLFWYATLKKQEQDIMSIAVKYGDSFVNFAKESTHNSMLSLDKTQTQRILENLSTPEGVQRVKIFDHKGNVEFSSDQEEVGNEVDINSMSCRGCHTDPVTGTLSPSPKKWSKYKDKKGSTSLKIVSQIYNDVSCSSASCHVHPEEQKILGFVETDLSLALLDEALFKQGLALTAYVIIFVIAVSLFLGIINYKIVTNPVHKLSDGMKQVAGGDLDHPVQIDSIDEIGVLASTFNSMIKDLKAAAGQKARWTQTLEEEVAKKTEEIKRTQTGLIQTEKLASLGRMAAGVAHEINNPLTGVVTFAHLMRQRCKPGSDDAEDLDVIIEQAERCAKIIKNLLTFARATPSEKGKIHINNVITKTMTLVKNQEKFHNVKFHMDLADANLVTDGDGTQFQQICLNMFLNAADAMNLRGDITVKTHQVEEKDKPFVETIFTDTGSGIKEEDLPKLFEPFFTTKPVDKGTGLGLSITHGIVKHLGGSIRVKSTLGQGTSFFVRLPLIKQEI
ncbi:sensor protein ZraS [bacterium BMS3Bbin09]|nr:sensor protein ZraS [bacterium BMS3Bbin09]